MRRVLRDNGLFLAMLVFFVLSFLGQVVTGHSEYNDDQKSHGGKEIGFAEYFGTGHFLEATFENWESEFLQMGSFVVLTVFLRQKGSPESKKMDEAEEVDREPDPNRKDAPWAARREGLVRTLYENSLGLALFALFFMSFALHAIGGSEEYTSEQHDHGQKGASPIQYVTTSRFWFESFQNWQSEFMSVGALVVLSIFLRQKGSPESKPVDEATSTTGSA